MSLAILSDAVTISSESFSNESR
ncbi:hypothetical protein Q525_02652 [Staphylococcus aureus M1357]|nr:hypothetical protein Q525_02652 [Staphylococcus aureus M1357]